jgi:hypothetical protein
MFINYQKNFFGHSRLVRTFPFMSHFQTHFGVQCHGISTDKGSVKVVDT